MEKMRKVYSTKFAGKSKGSGIVNRANNKINFGQVCYEFVDSVHLNHNGNQLSACLNKEMKLRVL